MNQLEIPCIAQRPDLPKKVEILYDHLHLEHPPFPLLKHLFPSLFQNVLVGDFSCDVCQLVKSHRLPFNPYEIKLTIGCYPYRYLGAS